MKKISIIVPAYNVEKYISECIESLIKQTWKNIEIIIIDDGSNDHTGSICDEFAIKDNRIIVVHKGNGGVSSARNAGLDLASGDYIGFCDGDDYVDERLYEHLASTIDDTNSDIAVCDYIEYLPHDENDVVKHDVVDSLITVDVKSALNYVLKRNGYFVSIWNKLFKREVIHKDNHWSYFDTELAIGEDEVWLVNAITQSTSISFSPEALYHWRANMGSATRKDVISERKMSIIRSKERVLAMVIPYGKQLKQLANSRLLNDSYHLRVLAYDSGNKEYGKRVLTSISHAYPDWMICKDVPFLRKCKVIVMEIMIRLHFPTRWVYSVHNVLRKNA